MTRREWGIVLGLALLYVLLALAGGILAATYR